QDLGTRAREHRRAVMFRDPVTVIAESLRELRELHRIAQRIHAGRALGDRRLIEHAETNHPRTIHVAVGLRNVLAAAIVQWRDIMSRINKLAAPVAAAMTLAT